MRLEKRLSGSLNCARPTLFIATLRNSGVRGCPHAEQGCGRGQKIGKFAHSQITSFLDGYLTWGDWFMIGLEKNGARNQI